MPWQRLGEGSYNTTYINTEKTLVLKVSKNFDELSKKSDTPERSVRLWNLINSYIHPHAKVVTLEDGRKAWTCPFIVGTPASDEEISLAVLEIFSETKRIIVDAIAKNNFIKTPPPKSHIVCIDIGMALQLDELTTEAAQAPSASAPKLIRQSSDVSTEIWQDLLDDYQSYFAEKEKVYPKAITSIKALLFIKEFAPQLEQVQELTESILKYLSVGYDLNYGYKKCIYATPPEEHINYLKTLMKQQIEQSSSATPFSFFSPPLQKQSWDITTKQNMFIPIESYIHELQETIHELQKDLDADPVMLQMLSLDLQKAGELYSQLFLSKSPKEADDYLKGLDVKDISGVFKEKIKACEEHLHHMIEEKETAAKAPTQ